MRILDAPALARVIEAHAATHPAPRVPHADGDTLIKPGDTHLEPGAPARFGPRVVASGNFASPARLLELVDKVLPQYTLFQLNAQPGIPVREGVRHETPFVGPGMRALPNLGFLPARLSLVPRLLAATHVPDLVLLHVAAPRDGRLSL